MKTELKDVIHLYHGAKLINSQKQIFELEPHLYLYGNFKNIETLKWKPILRPLSDMKREELEHILHEWHKSIFGDMPKYSISFFDTELNEVGMVIDTEENERIGITVSENNTEISLDSKNMMVNQYFVTKYLLKQGFDLFGLIESGQAIDKTTIK